ncbi:MAG: flagellar hook basal-body protein [Dactylosporangium sp.]|nr:flagellar hook basal-body protein [Dactylosporangium sp.]
MLRGIYTAANGMIAQGQMQDVIANNLANEATPGFKRSLATVGAFPWQFVQLAGGLGQRVGMGTGALVDRTILDWSQGEIQPGSPTDAAIQGDGFFAVRDAAGQTLYTRSGHFHVDTGGNLVDDQGRQVLGTAGPLRVSGTREVSLGADGTVYDGTTPVGRIAIFVTEPGAAMVSIDGSAYRVQGNVRQVTDVQLAVGSVELSNVDPIREMTQLMSVVRTYEGSRQAFQAQDAAAQRAIGDIGRF